MILISPKDWIKIFLDFSFDELNMHVVVSGITTKENSTLFPNQYMKKKGFLTS